jgi:hypothetical protein
MGAVTMLQTAVVLFAIAALGGLAMACIRFVSNVNPPAALALLHGLLASSGLTLVAYAAFTVGVPSGALLGLGLLLAAAAGGLVMNLGYQWKQRLLPAVLVVGHAILAVLGFGLLAMAAFAH